MRLVTLECPKCGAQLELNPALKQAYCNYCGFQFLVDDEIKRVNIDMENPRQFGYEFEWGKSAQHIDEGRSHAEKVRTLIQPITEMNRLIKESNLLYQQVQGLWNRVNNTSINPLVISLCAPALVIIVTIALGDHIGFYVVGLAIAALSFLICYYFQKYAHNMEAQQLEEKTRQYENIYSRVSYITQEYDIDFIPQNYRYEEAMVFFYNVLINQRAFNLPQAINLYEDEKHKAAMKALQEEQLLIQKKQLKAAEEQRKQLQNMEDLKEEKSSSTLGKAVVAGSVFLAAVSLLKNRDK